MAIWYLNMLQEGEVMNKKHLAVFLEENIDYMIFKNQADLKKPKYKNLEIWKDGWETIMLGAFPKGDDVKKEIEEVISYVNDATDEQKEQYKNSDIDSTYYIKEYLKKEELDYDEDTIEYLEDQCKPIIKHHKNHFNRARPYQVAEKLDMEFNRFITETSKTPSYPSGHTVQPYVVAEYYSKLYPQHRAGLINGAKIAGFGRVIAGLHYPSDFDAGVYLAKELMNFMDFGKLKEDAPMNATGGAISMPPTMQKKKKKKRMPEDAFKVLKRKL